MTCIVLNFQALPGLRRSVGTDSTPRRVKLQHDISPPFSPARLQMKKSRRARKMLLPDNNISNRTRGTWLFYFQVMKYHTDECLKKETMTYMYPTPQFNNLINHIFGSAIQSVILNPGCLTELPELLFLNTMLMPGPTPEIQFNWYRVEVKH